MKISGIARYCWKLYEKALTKYPGYTKGITGGVLSGIGDFCVQSYFEKKEKLNLNRLMVMFSYGFLQTKLEVVYWYKFLDKIYGKQKTVRTSFMKTLTDLVFFAPFEIAFCISWVSYFEGKKVEIIEKIREEFRTILMTSYLVWFPFGFLCFYLVPVRCRALYIGLVSLGWDMYISFAAHNSVALLR